MFSWRYLRKFIIIIKIPLCLYHSDPWFLVWWSSPLSFRRVVSLFCFLLGNVIYYIPVSLFNFFIFYFYKLVIYVVVFFLDLFSWRYLCKFIIKIKMPLCLYHSDPWFLVWWSSPLSFRRGVSLFCSVLCNVIYYIPVSLFKIFFLFYKLVIYVFLFS